MPSNSMRRNPDTHSYSTVQHRPTPVAPVARPTLTLWHPPNADHTSNRRSTTSRAKRLNRLATESIEKVSPKSRFHEKDVRFHENDVKPKNRLSPRSQQVHSAFCRAVAIQAVGEDNGSFLIRQDPIIKTEPSQPASNHPVLEADDRITPRSASNQPAANQPALLDDRITPRTIASLGQVNFDTDPWLNALSPITPANTDVPVSWAGLASTTKHMVPEKGTAVDCRLAV
jgi:hypothetical protein